MANAKEALPQYGSHEQFFLRTPLYDRRQIAVHQIQALFEKPIKFDGFCYFCQKQTTLEKSEGNWGLGTIISSEILKTRRIGTFEFECARNSNHAIRFYYQLIEGSIQKTGQWPSFADIALDESKAYSKLLDDDDRSEFHKAIGLAAHGVGIGAYVYLRRIFERLIQKRFDEYKALESWNEADFLKLRMKERIEFLKGHLPEFLVNNSKLYSILSLGVHELKEKDCLSFFPVLRQSTIWILEQDKKKQEELEQRKNLEEAIAKFSPTADQA